MRPTPPAYTLLPLVLLFGCAGAHGDAPDGEPPMVLGFGSSEVQVSHPLDIVGGNFLSGVEGHTLIQLTGTYYAKGGNTYDIDMELRPQWKDGNRLEWSHFGPYSVPFSPTGDEIGVFEGELVGINVYEGGDEVPSEPVEVNLEVLPSIILRRLQVEGAECSEPSRVVMGNYNYEIAVEAIGFDPVNFTYVTDGQPSGMARIQRKEATAAFDSFGSNGELYFDPVPAERTYYVGVLAVGAMGSDGIERIFSANVGVHRPVEYIVYDRVEIGEIEAAQPVSGCISGGRDIPRTVGYTEEESETRSRQFGVTWNEEWLEQVSQSEGGSSSNTFGYNFSRTEEDETGTIQVEENGRDIEGGGNIGGTIKLVEIGFEGKYRDIKRNSTSSYDLHRSSRTVGMDFSHTDTETWATTNTSGYTVALGGQDFWTVTSEQSKIRSFEGQILPGQFGVFYRQTTRMSIPGALVVYNKCGVPEIVAEGNLADYQWSVDLAAANDCPPIPKTTLPDPQCYIDC